MTNFTALNDARKVISAYEFFPVSIYGRAIDDLGDKSALLNVRRRDVQSLCAVQEKLGAPLFSQAIWVDNELLVGSNNFIVGIEDEALFLKTFASDLNLPESAREFLAAYGKSKTMTTHKSGDPLRTAIGKFKSQMGSIHVTLQEEGKYPARLKIDERGFQQAGDLSFAEVRVLQEAIAGAAHDSGIKTIHTPGKASEGELFITDEDGVGSIRYFLERTRDLLFDAQTVAQLDALEKISRQRYAGK